MSEEENVNAEVIAVYPNKVKISVDDLQDFKIAEESLQIGSFLEISDNENAKLLAMIDHFSIEVGANGERKYILEGNPLGSLKDGKFTRGGDELAIPPKGVTPAKLEDVKHIYESTLKANEKFKFAKLSRNAEVEVPVEGNSFFNKHIAVVGSTGSGKSHTVSKIIQEAVKSKSSGYEGLNNSHVVIFDIHSEYKTAFPKANYIDISNLTLPYWLLNSEEIEELFLDTEANDHNQRNVLKEAIVYNKKKYLPDGDSRVIHYDSPTKFSLSEVLTYVTNRNKEKQKNSEIPWEDASGEEFIFNETTAVRLFEEGLKTKGSSASGTNNGKFGNFINRLENKISDKRLSFFLGDNCFDTNHTDVIKQILGFVEGNKSNVTILDVSGVPFEVLSITVSLVSRMLFDFGFYLKKNSPEEHKTPLLLVYEEAHKYVPKSELAKYRSSRNSIERIAKEGRKYGVSLMLASQRPSEISETIFSQCSNFIAMRLTNPQDQSYVKRLLPDALGNVTDSLPALKAGEALLIGEAVIMPSLVQINRCNPEPSSSSIPYFEIWKKEWQEPEFGELIRLWQER